MMIVRSEEKSQLRITLKASVGGWKQTYQKTVYLIYKTELSILVICVGNRRNKAMYVLESGKTYNLTP